MKTKMLVLGAFIAGILSAFFGGKAFATAGNTAEISSGTWEICVNATLDTQSPDFSLDITKSGFKSQLVLGGGECKTVKLTGSSAYTVSLGSAMGASSVNYEVSGSSLTFNVANSLNKYLNAFGSVTYTTEGSGEESDFELLFSMPGTCYLNGNANVSGDTCKDSDGNPLTDKKYIDTGVALFSEDNAARDFEIYFTLDDYASTQPNNQGTLFNAKYEDSTMLYPGFTFRMSGSNVQMMELTGRIGNDNTAADKAQKYISTASLNGKEMKIVRVGGLVSYSIDGGELIEFQNYQNFSRYFEQSAVFGASLQTNGTPQRYYDGTVSNIRIYLKKVGSIEFNANGGTGTMSAIENAQLGASVTLPANTFTREGYEFAGWNTAADGTGTDYADEAEVTITSADTSTLYAQWVEKPKGRIEFSANGGTGAMAAIEDIIVGNSATLPANTFTRTNHSFEGWNTAADGTGTDYADEADVTISSSDTLILYAQWEELKGSILFNANGGTGTMAAIEDITLGTSVTLPVNTFTRGGYEFAGWNTAADGMGMDYADEADAMVSSADALILYAQWEKQPRGRIEFDANGGTGAMASIEDIIVGEGVILPTNEFERTNYRFDGWNTAADGTGTDYVDGAEVTTSSAETLTLYAQWEELKGSITFNANGGIGTMAAIEDITLGASVTLPENSFTLTNATFKGWNTRLDGTGVNYEDGATVSIVTEKLLLYAQWSGEAILDSGVIVNRKIKNLASGDPDSSATFMSEDENIKAIKEANALPDGFDVVDNNIISEPASPIKIYAWFDDSDLDGNGQGDGIVYVFTTEDHIIAKNGMDFMFAFLASLSDISALASWDTSATTSLGNMFRGTSITNVDALETKQHEGKDYVSWDVSKVKNMDYLFSDISSLSNISALASWNTSTVTRMSYMFRGTSITNVDALETKQHEGKDYVSWDISKVYDVFRMFAGCSSLSDISALASWDTSSVKNMSTMFSGTTLLSDISALASWNTSAVTDMGSMFYNSAITNVNALETKQYAGKDYVSWNTSSVKDMSSMFAFSASLSDISALASWNTSAVTKMASMFYNDKSLSNISALASWNTSAVVDMNRMFSFTAITNVSALETKQHTGKDYVSWNTSSVKDMAAMFQSTSSLVDISAMSSWDVSSVTSISSMFYQATALSDISALASWDTSAVTNMSSMFAFLASLSDISALASWNTAAVKNMSGMFSRTTIKNVNALETKQYAGKDYVSWDTSRVEDVSFMFDSITTLTDISALASWNTSAVTNMAAMFQGAYAITDVSALAAWDTSKVTKMYSMFSYVYKCGDFSVLEEWDTSAVTNMNNIFYRVSASALLPSWRPQ